MWCAIAMPPYGGFFMAVNPLQKHIFRGALNVAGHGGYRLIRQVRGELAYEIQATMAHAEVAMAGTKT